MVSDVHPQRLGARLTPILALAALIIAGSGCDRDQVQIVGPDYSPWAHIDPGWTMELPVFGTEFLFGVDLVSADEAWVVGSGGLVLQFLDGNWQRVTVPTRETLVATVAAPDGVRYAVGSGGVILRRAADIWGVFGSGSEAPLRDLAVTADGAVWTVGDGGKILRNAGSGWETLAGVTDRDLACVTAVGDDVMIGGNGGTLLRYTAGQWQTEDGFTEAPIKEIATNAAGEIFLLSDRIFRYQDGDWVDWEYSYWDVCSLALGDSVVLTGEDDGMVFLHDLSQPWDVEIERGVGPITAIDVIDSGEVFAVSLERSLLWHRGDGWRNDPAARLSYAWLIRLGDGTVLLQVQEKLLDRESDGWRHVISLPDWEEDSRWRVDGPSLDRLHCLSEDGFLIRIDGAGWLVLDEYVFDNELQIDIANDFLVLSDTEVWIGNCQGVFRWDGTGWKEEETLQSICDYGLSWRLSITAGGQVFALGEDQVHLYEGSTWHDLEPFRGWRISRYGTVCGSYPEALYLIGRNWLAAYSGDDPEILTESGYQFPRDAPAEINCVTSDGSGIYVTSEFPGYVLKLEGQPGNNSWRVAAGPVGDYFRSFVVLDDGSFLGLASRAGGVFHYPAPR